MRIEVTPDHAGYVEAQERLRGLLGEAIVLLGPVEAAYPAGTPLDPESGEPFDPLVQPSSSGQSSALIHGRVAYHGLRLTGHGAAETAGAPGFMGQATVVVIASSAAASAASGCVAMLVRDEQYEIRTAHFDGIAGVDRFLIVGAKEG